MRVRLDECVDRRLAGDIQGHDVKTVPDIGWAALTNGELRALKKEHTRVTNRVKGLLANQGIRLPKGTDLGAVLDTLRLWDGSALPAKTQS